MKWILMTSLLISTALMTSGCKTLERIQEIGDTPPISHIQNPHASRGYQPVTMPMPNAKIPENRENSLWQTGSQGFFKDQRAGQVGDILTVAVNVSDTASLSNSTDHSRQTDAKLAINNFGGFESQLSNSLPDNVDPKKLIGLTSNPTHKGTGTISRNETISFKVAASIIQILPNGNFLISGRQEMRINNEVREIALTGIVRPEDISSSNTVDATKIAEARMTYGGRGDLTNVQQAPVGHQIIDTISPF